MSTTTFEEAKSSFKKYLSKMSTDDKADFVTFMFNELTNNGVSGGITEILNDDSGPQEGRGSDEETLDDPCTQLKMIADDLKSKVPLDAIFPYETIKSQSLGERPTLYLDEFLYTEEDVEELVEEGKLKRYYCRDCKSTNTDSIVLISHSMSRDVLYYIFNDCLPILENQTVLDIGSRLGAVLYGAYYYTDASRIIGVEMNEYFCKLQKDIIEKYKLQNRVEIVQNKIEHVPDLIGSANVIIINNVSELYDTEDKQIEIWQLLRKNAKKSTILVTSPTLETYFENLKPDIILDAWVKCYKFSEPTDNFMNFSGFLNEDIGIYEVL